MGYRPAPVACEWFRGLERPEADVEDHPRVGRVGVMRVAPPAGGVKVNFNVAAEQGSTNLETGTREIRTSLDVPAARRQDADGATVASLQVVRVEKLVGPDGLNETLGDRDGLVEVRRLAEG